MKTTDAPKTPKKHIVPVSAFHGLQLLLIQSSVCILLLGVTLCLKWIGGPSFDELTSRFRGAMLEDTLIKAVSSAVSIETVSAQNLHNADKTHTYTKPLLQGEMTSSFGEREDVSDPNTVSFHEGIDIAAEENTPIFAIMNGTVTTVEYDEKGYGHYIVVTVNDTQKYLYAHCSQILAKLGDKVLEGDTIALVGNTGRSTGSHLHFEWIENGTPVDPMTVISESWYA